MVTLALTGVVCFGQHKMTLALAGGVNFDQRNMVPVSGFGNHNMAPCAIAQAIAAEGSGHVRTHDNDGPCGRRQLTHHSILRHRPRHCGRRRR